MPIVTTPMRWTTLDGGVIKINCDAVVLQN